MSIYDTEERCEQFLERLRWRGIVTSPFSPTGKVYECSHGRYKCKDSGKYFNVRTGTIFHNTKIPLTKWFAAIELIISKEMTAESLAVSIGVSQKSAWLVLRRLKRIGIEYSPPASEPVKESETLDMAGWLSKLKQL